jgi:uncharacterized protein YecT (DUF1311 family)
MKTTPVDGEQIKREMMISEKNIILLILFILVSSFSVADGPSFDCTKSQTDVEKTICSTYYLSKYDLWLGDLYEEYLSSLSGNQRSEAKNHQREWLKMRDNKCGIKPICLKQLYEEKIRYYELKRPSRLSKIVGVYDNHTIRNFQTFFVGGNLIFSEYRDRGNNQDIKQLDPIDGDVTILASDIYGARFLALNENYLVARQDLRMADPLIVLDRSTGKTLAKKRFNDDITYAEVDQSELFIVQGKRLRNTDVATAMILELPSLNIVDKFEILAGNGIAKWGNLHVTLGEKISLYDRKKELVRSTGKLSDQYDSEKFRCLSSGLSVHQNMAFVVFGCGLVGQYALPSLAHIRTYKRIDIHSKIALENNLLFISSETRLGTPINVHVYDIESGKLLYILPIHAPHIYVTDNKLISVDMRFNSPTRITVHELMLD